MYGTTVRYMVFFALQSELQQDANSCAIAQFFALTAPVESTTLQQTPACTRPQCILGSACFALLTGAAENSCACMVRLPAGLAEEAYLACGAFTVNHTCSRHSAKRPRTCTALPMFCSSCRADTAFMCAVLCKSPIIHQLLVRPQPKRVLVSVAEML